MWAVGGGGLMCSAGFQTECEIYPDAREKSCRGTREMW